MTEAKKTIAKPSEVSADDVPPTATGSGGGRRRIQSADKATEVLLALVEAGKATPLRDLARAIGMPNSLAHRYLASLIASGMAHQDASSGRYDLGPQAIQIGLAALARTDVFADADPAIAAFTRETGRTTLVAARGPLGPTIVRWHAGRPPVTTSLTVGSVLPLLGSATGHVFLSFMNDEEAADAIEDEKSVDKRGADVDAIRSKVRGAMSASVDETLIPGLRATAVPILDIQARAALVVTVIATSAFDRRNDQAVVEGLMRVCRTLTEKIGGQWSTRRKPPASASPR